MIIQTDEEGKKLVEGLCDVALKVGGLQNLNAVTSALRALVPLPQKEADDS